MAIREVAPLPKATSKPGVVVAVTLDTKGEEAEFVTEELRKRGINVILVDCGVLGQAALTPTISAAEVARAARANLDDLRASRDRAASIPIMMRGLSTQIKRLLSENLVQGFLGLGGATNAALAAAAFAVIPIGIPKVLVSTVVSGNTREIVGFKDVVLFHSVVDVLGVGSYLRRVLCQAAALVEALVRESQRSPEVNRDQSVAMTTFGSTTAAANHAIELLREHSLEILTFHAEGVGGRAAEAFMLDGQVQSSFDLTTTEIADELVGGFFTAGQSRLDAAAIAGLPQVVLPGAVHMVNFGARDTVPERFAARQFLAHTPYATLMRTTPDENEEIARFIARKLNQTLAPAAFVLPTRGFSAYDAEGAAFFDPVADGAFREALCESLDPKIELIEVDAHINERRCMEVAVAAFVNLIHQSARS